MKDLGWANGWGKLDPMVVRCNQLGHNQHEVPCPSGRGIDNRRSCRKCGYFYHYDSSD